MAKGDDNGLTLEGQSLFGSSERNARHRSAIGGSARVGIFGRAAASNGKGGVAPIGGDPV
jgi:hypothetical protein